MTLHNAIEKVLLDKGPSMATQEIADRLNSNKSYQKQNGSKITAFQIHGRTKTYPQYFRRVGSLVSLTRKVTKESVKNRRGLKSPRKKSRASMIARINKDENYVLDLCDQVLLRNSIRQYKFDFLVGDPTASGSRRKLPVDSFYPDLRLVIEYREKQHTEDVKFFDKPCKQTISGGHRGEQRKLYDERRRQILPANGYRLVEISYDDFLYNNRKRIVRNRRRDLQIIRIKLKMQLGKL